MELSDSIEGEAIYSFVALAGFEGVLLETRLDLEALLRYGASDQVYHNHATDQWAASLVGRDVARTCGAQSCSSYSFPGGNGTHGPEWRVRMKASGASSVIGGPDIHGGSES